jgi:predicted RNA-binding protein with PUA-like domain
MTTWLLKTEPSTYAFDDLVRDRVTAWTGVKNPGAQLHLRAMRRGDEVVVYHSGVKAAVGLGRVARTAYPDPGGDGTRVCVDVAAGKRLASPVPLAALRGSAPFRGSPLLVQGRLSVVPLTPAQRKALLALAGAGARPPRS